MSKWTTFIALQQQHSSEHELLLMEVASYQYVQGVLVKVRRHILLLIPEFSFLNYYHYLKI